MMSSLITDIGNLCLSSFFFFFLISLEGDLPVLLIFSHWRILSRGMTWYEVHVALSLWGQNEAEEEKQQGDQSGRC